MRPLSSLVLAALAAPCALAELPEPLKSALGRSADVPAFVFDVERVSTDTGEDGETVTGHARVDLAAPELKQITPAHLADPDKPGSSFEALAGIERALEDGIWCTRFAANVPADAKDIEIIAEDAETVTYGFTPEADGDADGPEKKIAKRSRAEMTVSRADPAILRYASSLTGTVTLYVVAKIRRVDVEATCARAPDGRTYVAETRSAVEAGGFGDDSGNSSVMRITALYDPQTGARLAP